MKDGRQLVGLLICVGLLAGCAGPGSATAQGIGVGNRTPDFSLQSLDGDKVSLSDYRGQVILLNFWASWCEPCRAEIPDLEAAYQAHKDEGLVVLGLNVAESRRAIKPFVEELGISYPILLDEQDRMMKQFRGRGLPMSLLIDRDGVIRERHMGILTAAQLEEYLAKVLPKR